MKAFSSFLPLLALFIGGCNSPSSSHPWLLAPSEEDWRVAFSRLAASEQEIIKIRPLSFTIALSADSGALCEPKYGPPGGKPIPFERLDMHGICAGFNRAFASHEMDRFEIIDAVSFEQIGTPNGLQHHFIELHWTFRHSSGLIGPISEYAFGPSVDIKWFPSEVALRAEANQAVALAFLKVAVDLSRLSEKKKNVPPGEK
jgi:hypothetical protein